MSYAHALTVVVSHAVPSHMHLLMASCHFRGGWRHAIAVPYPFQGYGTGCGTWYGMGCGTLWRVAGPRTTKIRWTRCCQQININSIKINMAKLWKFMALLQNKHLSWPHLEAGELARGLVFYGDTWAATSAPRLSTNNVMTMINTCTDMMCLIT